MSYQLLGNINGTQKKFRSEQYQHHPNRRLVMKKGLQTHIRWSMSNAEWNNFPSYSPADFPLEYTLKHIPSYGATWNVDTLP